MCSAEDAWNALRQEILECTLCPLSESRTQAVPGEGPQNATLVILGEAPGRSEDLQGRPFVGAAGKLLTELLKGAGIDRSAVFITNTVKCRPPDNRPPTPREREICSPFLQRLLQLVKPKVLCLAGRVPAETILDTRVRMSASHGKQFEREGQTYYVIYHPAAGLYTRRLLPVMQQDMSKLKSLLDEKTGQVTPARDRQRRLTDFSDS
jgi:DNA polymerase